MQRCLTFLASIHLDDSAESILFHALQAPPAEDPAVLEELDHHDATTVVFVWLLQEIADM